MVWEMIEFEQLNYNASDKLIKGKKVKLLDVEKNFTILIVQL